MRRAAMKTYWKELILGTFYMLATYVLFYLMATFSLSYGRAATTAALPGFGQDDKSSVLLIIGVVYFDIFTMASGPCADRLAAAPRAARAFPAVRYTGPGTSFNVSSMLARSTKV